MIRPDDLPPGVVEAAEAAYQEALMRMGFSPHTMAAAIAAALNAWPEADRLRAQLARAKEGLRIFSGAAYPVATEINPQGYVWSKSYLDEALTEVRAILAELEK